MKAIVHFRVTLMAYLYATMNTRKCIYWETLHAYLQQPHPKGAKCASQWPHRRCHDALDTRQPAAWCLLSHWNKECEAVCAYKCIQVPPSIHEEMLKVNSIECKQCAFAMHCIWCTAGTALPLRLLKARTLQIELKVTQKQLESWLCSSANSQHQ